LKLQTAGSNFKLGTTAENKRNTYRTTNKGKKMASDWPNTTQTTKCNRKTICTGTVRVKGRRVHHEQPGKEQQNGNCSRLGKVGKGEKY